VGGRGDVTVRGETVEKPDLMVGSGFHFIKPVRVYLALCISFIIILVSTLIRGFEFGTWIKT